MKYKLCPNCGKKGLHELAVNDNNILMRRGIDYECKYCGYTEDIIRFDKRREEDKLISGELPSTGY